MYKHKVLWSRQYILESAGFFVLRESEASWLSLFSGSMQPHTGKFPLQKGDLEVLCNKANPHTLMGNVGGMHWKVWDNTCLTCHCITSPWNNLNEYQKSSVVQPPWKLAQRNWDGYSINRLSGLWKWTESVSRTLAVMGRGGRQESFHFQLVFLARAEGLVMWGHTMRTEARHTHTACTLSMGRWPTTCAQALPVSWPLTTQGSSAQEQLTWICQAASLQTSHKLWKAFWEHRTAGIEPTSTDCPTFPPHLFVVAQPQTCE